MDPAPGTILTPRLWQAAVEAFSYGNVYEVARCQWRLAEALLSTRRPGAGDRAPPGPPTRPRCGLAPSPCGARWRRWPGAAASTLALACRPSTSLAGLTPRELEVLRLLVEGHSNRQIAEQLFISGKTASVHVTNLLAKLGRAQPPGGRRHGPTSRPGSAGTRGLCDLTAERPWPGLLPRPGPTTDRATCRHPGLKTRVTAASAPPKVKAPSVGDLRSSPHDWLTPLPLASGVEHPTG